MVDIISSTFFIAGSGIASFTFGGQTGGAVSSGTALAAIGPSTSTEVLSPGGFTSANQVVQRGTSSHQGFVVVSSGEEITSSIQLLLFPASFSRAATIFGVIGTVDTVEKFFDRSPSFFGPHEADPNTLRDLSEAQQFLVFTQATLTSFDNFRNTIGTGQIVTVKGSRFSPQAEFTELLSNGGFESDLSGWVVVTKEPTDLVETRTSQPAGVGFNDSVPVLPPEGVRYLYTRKASTTGTLAVRQSQKLGGIQTSNRLKNFSFQAVFDDAGLANRRNLVAVRFLFADQQRHLIHYRFGSQGQPDLPSELINWDTRVFLSATSDVLNSYARNLNVDTSQTSFSFDEIQIWIVSDTNDGTATDSLWDNFRLTADIPPAELLATSDFAHILTGHPTASGFPFTISGSDGVLQVDLLPPYFDETFPVSGTTFNPPNTPVSFHIKDISSPLNEGSIQVFIDDEQVVLAGTANPGATWPTVIKTVLAPNDIRYELTRSSPFDPQHVAVVSGTFADLADVSNGTTQVYEFTILGSGSLNAEIIGLEDGDPPGIFPTYPQDLDTQVSPNTSLTWSLTDNASGVDPTSVRLYLNNALVLSNDVATGGLFSRTPNASRGFDYTFTPTAPFAFGQTVTGTIEAVDFATNSGSLTYQFTITPDDTLEIINFFLGENESTLLTSGTIASVEIVDFTHGVASGTSYITLDGVTPSGLVTTYSGSGPDRVIFSFPLEPLVTFRENLNILVHAENLFPGPFPVIREQEFILRPGYDVFWPNKTEQPEGGPETKFPYITNIPVLTEIKNFAKRYGQTTEFYRFLTEDMTKANLGAYIESNIKTADLEAVMDTSNPYYEYGKTITVEIEVSDLEGNQLHFTHTYTIEDAP